MKNFLHRQQQKLLKFSLRDAMLSAGPLLFLMLVLLVAAYEYFDPAPPHQIVISTGTDDSNYDLYAQTYRDILADDHIKLVIRKSPGAAENLRLLKDEHSDIDVAFVQDGLHTGEATNLYSLGSVSYEPIWVFYRGTVAHHRVADFIGKRIAIGRPQSGTNMLARQILRASGITDANTHLVEAGNDKESKLLQQGQVDAAFFIGQPDSSLIRPLFNLPELHPLSYDQAEAYTRQFPFLHHLTLPQGVLDLQHNVPPQEIEMIATTSTLVIKDSLHPALVSLLLETMSEVHGDASLLNKGHEFPENRDADFELSPEAARYYKSGPPFLQRYLPFWLATLVDRAMVVLIPALAMLMPISRAVPRIYAWRIKNRIFRWYGELKDLEAQIKQDNDTLRVPIYLERLEIIEQRVAELPVPLGFSDYFYVLKEHIDLVRRKIQRLGSERA